MKNEVKRTPAYAKWAAILGIVIGSLLGAVAFATVTFDKDAGTGFVGIGDVKTAFGWTKNEQLQTNAPGVTFRYEQTATFQAVCQWATGNPDHPQSINTHTITRVKTGTLSGVLQFDARKQNQYTGWLLNGYTAPLVVSGDAVPQVGDVCLGDPDGNGNAPVGTYISVTPDPVTLTNILYAVFNGVSKQVWPVAVI